MPDLWITVKIQLRWLLSAVIATKEQSARDHAAARASPAHAAELRASADLHDEASEGLKVIQKRIEDDCD